MKISIIGTGYVGLVTGTCLAESGNDVLCMDLNETIVEKLSKGECTIYEPQLEELLQKNIKEERLSFTSSLQEAADYGEIIFLCLPTPQDDDGSADLSRVLNVSKDLAKIITSPKVIAAKSTIPPGSSIKIKGIFKKHCKTEIDYVFNPEFLKEGNAVSDFLSPDRVVIGSSSEKAVNVMRDLYSAFMRRSNRFIVMDETSAEVTKYAANSMLAIRISFMNDIAALCEKINADVDLVREGVGSDERIGNRFLFPGLGYGGSCFPKDVKALIKTADEQGIDMKLLRAADEINRKQRINFFKKIKRHFGEKLNGLNFAVWGLSYKPRTDDIRESPGIELIERIVKAGGRVSAFDPAANDNAEKYFTEDKNKISFSNNYYDALKDSDALIVSTEWNEFRHPDFDKMRKLMKSAVIFDGRNIYNRAVLKQKKFVYYGIGK